MKRLLIPCTVAGVIFCFLTNTFFHIKKAGASPDLTFVRNADMYSMYLPFLTFIKESVLAGSFPLWTPYLEVGRPVLAEIALGVLYPVNWAIFLLDMPYALLAIMASTIIIAMLGMLFYLAYLKLGWPARILGSVLFGYAVLLDSFVPGKGSTVCWLPAVIWLAHRLFDKPSFRACTALAVSLTLCFLAGFPNYFYYICIIGFIYFFIMTIFSWSEYQGKGAVLRLGMAGLALLLMLGLVSIQLFPTVELSMSSVRSVTSTMVLEEGSPFDSFSLGLMFRNYLDRNGTYCWANKFHYLPFPAYYLGSSLLLVPFALASRKNRPVVIALLGAMVYIVLFVLSKQIQALAIFGKIPLADTLRFHGRMIELAQFMIAALASIGLSSLWEGGFLRFWNSQAGRPAWFWILTVIYLVGVSCAGFFLSDNWRSYSLIFSMVVVPCTLIVLILLSDSSKFVPASKKWLGWVLVILILIDIGSSRHVRLTIPATTNAGTADLPPDSRIRWIKENAGYDRVLLVDTAWSDAIFNHNMGAIHQFFGINSYPVFAPARWRNFVRSAIGPEEFDRIVSRDPGRVFSGIRFADLAEPFMRHQQMIGLISLRYCFHDHHLYENKFALPRAYLVNSYIITHNEEESLQAIKKNISRLSHTVILENAEPSFSSAKPPENTGRVWISRYGVNEVELHVEADEPSLVVLTDSYYPGWKAFVDGVEKTIWRANSLFRAVEVAPGKHTVAFKYQPASFRRGAAVSGITFLLILAGLFIERHRAGVRLTDVSLSCSIERG